MHDKNKSRIIAAGGIYLGFFLFLLVLNMLTPYIADDFRYLYSFNDRTMRIENISDVILSMRAHRYNMNGRIVAHTLVQILGLLPLWVFDILNAAAYVLQIALIHKLAQNHAPRSNLVLLAIFAGMWLYCPAFAQVNLWQDGSCNYLWSTVLALLFLLPYVNEYLFEKSLHNKLDQFFFLFLAFCMGAYSETASAAAIFIAILLLMLLTLEQKMKCKAIWVWGIVVACLGYLSIYTAPAQLREKGAEMTIPTLFANFLTAAESYWRLCGILLIVFAIALICNLLIHTDRRQIFLGLVFFAGSLAGNFIMMFAQYYTERSACGAFVFLLTADVILIYPLLGVEKYKPILLVGMVILTMMASQSLMRGTIDIYQTYRQIRDNEAHIYQCRENGIMDIEVPVVTATTSYSVAHSCKYLDTEDASIWPNYSMAYFYEINSIIGVIPE